MSHTNLEKKRDGKTVAKSKRLIAEFEIDSSPSYVRGLYHVTLRPQNVIIQFEVYQNEDIYNFRTKDVIRLNRYTEHIEVLADQILIPMAGFAQADPDNAIVQFWKSNSVHSRTMVGQYGKLWDISNSGIAPWMQRRDDSGWWIQITDASRWQSWSPW